MNILGEEKKKKNNWLVFFPGKTPNELNEKFPSVNSAELAHLIFSWAILWLYNKVEYICLIKFVKSQLRDLYLFFYCVQINTWSIDLYFLNIYCYFISWHKNCSTRALINRVKRSNHSIYASKFASVFPMMMLHFIPFHISEWEVTSINSWELHYEAAS